MSKLRLLPMVAVGVAGLLSVKALAGAELLPNLLATTAHAQAAPAKAKPPVGSTAPVAQRAAPAAACLSTASVLAKEAGVSPSELRILQNLGERRGQLDAREQAMDTQTKLLTSAELKLDAKIKALMALKAELQGLTTQANTQKAAEADRLVGGAHDEPLPPGTTPGHAPSLPRSGRS